MSKIENETPHLRFKGYNDVWERSRLSDIAIFSKGQGYSKGDLSEQGYPVILYGRLYTNYQTVIRFVDTYVAEIKGTIYSTGGEVVVPASGETAEDISRASAIVKSGILIGGDLNIVYPSTEIEPIFLALTFSCGHAKRALSQKAQGKSVVHLHCEDFKDISIPYPSKAEQTKISLLFELFDNLITLHKRKYEKLVEVKKSLLDKMFPAEGESEPKIRFKGFTDAWVQRKFSDETTVTRGLTYSPTNVVKEGIRILRSSNIDEDSFIYGDGDVFVDEACVNIEYASNGDILITSANGSSRLVGKHAIISGIDRKTAVHGGFMLLAKTERPYFINASMSSAWYKRFINIYVAGGNGAIGNLNKSDLDNQDFLVPDINEQNAVGELFETFDKLITLHQRMLEKLNNIKKSLLERMFV